MSVLGDSAYTGPLDPPCRCRDNGMGSEACAAVVRAGRGAGGLQSLWLDGNGADEETEARVREELPWVGDLTFQ